MRPVLKYSFTISAAFVASLSLFLLMQLLISLDTGEFKQTTTQQRVDIHMPEYQQEFRYRLSKPERPDNLEIPPPPILFEPQPQSVIEKAEFSISPVAINTDPQVITGLGLGASDGEYLPIVKVAPIYPYNALRSEIEGYVVVEFTVTKAGNVKDLLIVEAKPKNIFNRVAKEAVTNFKYRPKIVNGQPVEVVGVQNKFIFRITH